MKKALAALCIFAIVLNVYIVVFSDDSGDNLTDVVDDNIDDHIIPENFTVRVPDRNLGDMAKYDYSIFVEMYEENKTSGEWEVYTLKADGQLIDEILQSVVNANDGFNMRHSTAALQEITSATFEIIVDGSDKEKFTAHGSLDVSRTEYTDIENEFDEMVIQTMTTAFIDVDPLPRIPTNTTFDGFMKNYPNPDIPQERTLDEAIYHDRKLKINDNDTIFEKLSSEEDWVIEYLTPAYNWSVEGAERISGLDTLKINITTAFFGGFLDFNRKLWVANEIPFPPKVYVRINSSYITDDYEWYFIIEHSRTLIEGEYSYNRGTKTIPWGTCVAPLHYHDQHPKGEYTEWKNNGHMPDGGDRLSESSFNFDPEIAEQFALENSEGLNLFLKRYDDVVVNWASYKEENQIKDRLGNVVSGSFNWNLSFGYKPTSEEAREAWENREDEPPHWGYYVNLTRNLTKFDDEIKIINEGLYDWGSSELSKRDIDDEVVTLAGSEAIMKLDDDVKREAYGLVGDDIDFDDDTYFALAMGGFTAANMPGLEIIETITGITLPESKYSWVLNKGGILFTSGGGELFNAAVDVETGQMLYVMKVDGTDLYGILG
jgi:hypothetical protein